MNMSIGIQLLLSLGAFLFVVGLFAVLTRRNAIMALIGIELILNAASLNFVAFSQLYEDNLTGQVAALFLIVLAAAEIAVALAIVITVYRKYKTINLDELNTLKD